jgi:hypothetical protein
MLEFGLVWVRQQAKGGSMETPGSSDVTAIRPRVEKLLREFFDTEALPANEYGDWGPFPAGTAGVFLRLGQPAPEAPPILVVFSMVLVQVPKSPELLDFLNEINVNMSFLRAYWKDEAIFFSAELLAQTTDREELLIAAAQIGNASDSYDEVLRGRFGGILPFVDGS